MIISIINHTNGQISDEDAQTAIRAINHQIAQDFEPYWSMGARLRLEGRSTKKPGKQQLADMRGDAVIYLWSGADVPDAVGYHYNNNRGIPYGFVFTQLAADFGENWTVTLSHEALELIGDPEVNLLVQGPHPADPNLIVFHGYEMCDAVQAETYKVLGVDVSNFVLPLYFTGGEELGGRNDFLGRSYNGRTLASFSVNPGGYVGYFNPLTGHYENYSMKGDTRAAQRIAFKLKTEGARVYRHQYLTSSRTKPADLVTTRRRK